MNSPHRSSLIRRSVVMIAMGLTLISAVSTAWAATPVPATPVPTTVRPTSTSVPTVKSTVMTNPFTVQGSMAKDPGSSMGSDILAPSRVAVPVSPTATSNPRPMGANTGNAPQAGTTAASGSMTAIACMPLTTGNTPVAAFQSQWQMGEAITANFWGPAGTAGTMEPYADGQRLVQYFDKGRMESAADGNVTNGLLATELISGQMQTGDSTFMARSAAAIPVAGDPDNAGPTYAGLGTLATALFMPATQHTPTTRNLGQAIETTVAADGTVSMPSVVNAGSGPMAVSVYDNTTQHNVPQAFADYRNRTGVPAIGLAKSEAFLTTVKVGGIQKQVMVQVFERRVLTYTADNDPAFQVEMGNIGQHYYRWRYCS